MTELVEKIKSILGLPALHPAPARDGDLLSAVMPFKENYPKYALDGEGRLIGLNLAKTGLTDAGWAEICALPGAMAHLQLLNLSMNQLTAFEASGMPALRALNLNENPALERVSFPEALAQLERLEASECKLGRLEMPVGFRSLKWVDVQKNELAEVRLATCPELVSLDLSRNALKEFCLPFGSRALKYLFLNDNQLTLLEWGAAPRQLSLLHLRNNKLAELPEGLLSCTSLQTLYLHNNAFQGSLSSIIPSGQSDNAFKPVTDYLLALRGGKMQNERVKIIIVGNGRVGKTSMFRRLKGLPFNPNEKFTHGVQLGELDENNLPGLQKTKKLLAHVWDFGGQEIFYATHQFFLTDDAVYILAWTAQENVAQHRARDKDLLPGEEKWRETGYWLDNIRHHSKNSPLLMVQTHCDGQRTPINSLELAKEPYRAECLDFCAAEADGGLSTLKRLIADRLNTQMPHLGEDFPIAYDRLIGAIENIRTRNKISRTEFDALCQETKIPDGGEETVLKFLRITGTVVWFDQIETLRDTIFINPDWLTKQVYALINRDLEARKGRMDLNWIQTVLPDYTAAERTQLLELLQAFQLIFEAKDEGPGVFIAPQYLPPALEHDALVQFNKTKRRLAPAFQFRFRDFVPDNVMINFLSRYGPYSDQVYWKSGISFTSSEETDCIVEFDESVRLLRVFTPADARGRALQAEVCAAFVELGKRANAEIALEGKPFVSWQELSDAYQNRVADVRAVDNTWVKVGEYWHLFEPEAFAGGHKVLPEESAASPARQPAIFISYAWGGESESIVNKIDVALQERGIRIIRDKRDLGYRGSIKAFMEDIGRGNKVIVVLSKKYLESENCMFELTQIYQNKGFNARIFPIVMEDANIYSPVARIQYINYWDKKIAELDEALKTVERNTNLTEIQQELNNFADIRASFDKMAFVLKDMNALNPEIHRNENFESLYVALVDP